MNNPARQPFFETEFKEEKDNGMQLKKLFTHLMRSIAFAITKYHNFLVWKFQGFRIIMYIVFYPNVKINCLFLRLYLLIIFYTLSPF